MKRNAVFFTEVCPPTAEKVGVISALLQTFDQVYIVPISFYDENVRLSTFHLNTLFMHATKQWLSDPMRLHRIHVVTPIIHMEKSKFPYALDMFCKEVTSVHDLTSITAVFDIVEFRKYKSAFEKTIFFTQCKHVCLYLDATEQDDIDVEGKEVTMLSIANIAGRRSADVHAKMQEAKRHDEIARMLGAAVYRYAFDNNLFGLSTST